MIDPTRSSVEAVEDYIPGELLREYRAQSSKDVFVQILARRHEEHSVILPAVPEPLIVWIVSGEALVEERPLGGTWWGNRVIEGDFFLTTASHATELRWRAAADRPFRVIHVYIGLLLLTEVVREIRGRALSEFALREVSGECDPTLSALLRLMQQELAGRQVSASTIQGLAKALTVHLVRTYEAAPPSPYVRRGGLPAYKLHQVFEAMKTNLAQPFELALLAAAAELSEYHFSRVFKQATGLSPSRYFIRLRMEQAKRLLRESDESMVDIGMAVGYASPSHFSQVFRKEAGLTPGAYRAMNADPMR